MTPLLACRSRGCRVDEGRHFGPYFYQLLGLKERFDEDSIGLD